MITSENKMLHLKKYKDGIKYPNLTCVSMYLFGQIYMVANAPAKKVVPLYLH